MEKSLSINSLPLSPSRTVGLLQMPAKRTIIWVRWPVVIICAYLMIYSAAGVLPATAVLALPLLYVASNVALYYLKEEKFSRTYFYTSLVVFDTIILTLSLIINGHVETDFYLTYFLLIIIACILQDLRTLAIVTVLAPVIYGGLLFQFSADSSPGLYLRLPFLFITSLFFGYFAHLVRTERTLREHTERENRAKMEILGVVAHEFRTPLSIVQGFIQVIKDKIIGETTDRQEEALTRALKQCDDLTFTIDSVLETWRISAGAVSVKRNLLNVSQLLDDLKVNYDSRLEKPVPILWDYSSNLPAVLSDNVKLKIIIQNLINNAIRFTKKGEIRVSAAYDGQTRQVVFKVMDTGVGIPKETHSFIFEQFRQVDSSNTRSFGGVGLGLYIVKAFTDMLGGTISLESEVGKGSTFEVTIPVEPLENEETRERR